MAGQADPVPGVAPGLSQTSSTVSNSTPTTFSPPLIHYFKLLANDTLRFPAAQGSELTSVPFRREESNAELAQILNYFASEKADAQAPLPKENLDLSKPLSWYFISSSHNTYLSGNQVYGEATGSAYENVLARGCRCVEIDVWDGDEAKSESRILKKRSSSPSKGGDFKKHESLRDRISDKLRRSPSRGKSEDDHAEVNDSLASTNRQNLQPEKWTATSNSDRKEPSVFHGYTLTKEVPFREVCQSIRDAAFKHSDLPVIVSLEVHASPQQQEIMIEIMEETWKDMLVNIDTNDCKVLPSPDSLRNKILVKVKAAPLPPTEAELAAEAARLKLQISETSSSSEDESRLARKTSGDKVKKSKIIPALSALGKYTKAFHFKDLNTREALVPTHVFSLSEKKLQVVHAAPGPSIFSHNKNFFMRAYPQGTRIASSNLDPAIFWRKGVQMVALNWQKFDAGTMMNEAQFAGSGGWLLKPDGYRGDLQGPTKIGHETQADAIPRKRIQLSIQILAAQHIHCKKGRPDPYVKAELHVEHPEEVVGGPIKNEGHAAESEHKRQSKKSKGTEPDFAGEVLQFPELAIVEEFSFMRFKIMDDVLGKDNLLAWSCIRLDRLREGYRLLHLLNADGAATDAVMLVKIEKIVR